MPRDPVTADDRTNRLARIERIAGLLDSRFRLPGIGVRVGWDSILGLVPGVGDAVTALPAGWMIWHGHAMGARKSVLARMGLNAGIDLLVGSISLIGDIFDVAFKSHRKNLALLQREMQRKSTEEKKLEVAHA